MHVWGYTCYNRWESSEKPGKRRRIIWWSVEPPPTVFLLHTLHLLFLHQGNDNEQSIPFSNKVELSPFSILQNASVRFPRGTRMLRTIAGLPVLPRQKQEESHPMYMCKWLATTTGALNNTIPFECLKGCWQPFLTSHRTSLIVLLP